MSTSSTASPYKGFRFPQEIISHAVWLYPRFSLSYRDVEELLAERGIIVSYETVRQWSGPPWVQFGRQYANPVRRRRARPGDTWHLDEVFITINGKTHYLWRAVDQAGNVLNILVQRRRNKAAAGARWAQFFRKFLKGCQYVPRGLITDKLGSYEVAKKEVMSSVEHRKHKRLNNRAENAHQPTRQRERGYPLGVASVHVSWPCPALSVGFRAHPRALLPAPPPVPRRGVPQGTCASIPGLEGGHQPPASRIGKQWKGTSSRSSSLDQVSLSTLPNKLTVPPRNRTAQLPQLPPPTPRPRATHPNVAGTTESIIEAYNQATDLVALLESYGGRIAQHGRARRTLLHCPCPNHAHGDAHPSLEVQPAKQARYGQHVAIGHAPACVFTTERGQVMDAFRVFGTWEGLTPGEAVAWLRTMQEVR